MKRRDRKPRKSSTFSFLTRNEGHNPPPFVRAAIARHSADVDTAWDQYKNWRARGYQGSPLISTAGSWIASRFDEERLLLRDADELHRRQKEPCDVTSRREARGDFSCFIADLL